MLNRHASRQITGSIYFFYIFSSEKVPCEKMPLAPSQKWSADSVRSRRMIEGVFPISCETRFSMFQKAPKQKKQKFALKVPKLPEGPSSDIFEESAFASVGGEGAQALSFSTLQILTFCHGINIPPTHENRFRRVSRSLRRAKQIEECEDDCLEANFPKRSDLRWETTEGPLVNLGEQYVCTLQLECPKRKEKEKS